MKTISSKDKQMIQSLVQSWLNREKSQTKSECPNPESIAAYAFGELDPNDEKLMETHVIDCPKCLSEVVDLRDIKASTETLPKKAMSRLLDWAKLADKTRREIADNIFDKLSSLFPGYTDVELAYADYREGGKEGGKKVVRIPRQIWHITSPFAKRLSIIDIPIQEQPSGLRPLAEVLQKISFYYFIMGLGKDNRLKMISKDNDPMIERHLPLEVEASHVNDTDILWVVIDSEKEAIQNSYAQLLKEISKKTMTIPKIEPFAWVVVFVERKKLPIKKAKTI